MRVVDIRVKDVNELVQTAFSGLSPLVIEDVADEGVGLQTRLHPGKWCTGSTWSGGLPRPRSGARMGERPSTDLSRRADQCAAFMTSPNATSPTPTTSSGRESTLPLISMSRAPAPHCLGCRTSRESHRPGIRPSSSACTPSTAKTTARVTGARATAVNIPTPRSATTHQRSLRQPADGLPPRGWAR
ncbi:hypothetical protein GT031_12645 [Streptomyces sp. SID2888]|nr:hypothetical protein [Streptomyces sp. SID2888]